MHGSGRGSNLSVDAIQALGQGFGSEGCLPPMLPVAIGTPVVGVSATSALPVAVAVAAPSLLRVESGQGEWSGTL